MGVLGPVAPRARQGVRNKRVKEDIEDQSARLHREALLDMDQRTQGLGYDAREGVSEDTEKLLTPLFVVFEDIAHHVDRKANGQKIAQKAQKRHTHDGE